MVRKCYCGVEFIFDEENDKSVLKEKFLVYELTNMSNKEYIGKVGDTELRARLSSHARKIRIKSEEKAYSNGLGLSKRVHVRILKRCASKEEARMCEHSTIINRRRQIAECRGYTLTDKQLKSNKYSAVYNDILINTLS